MNDYIEEKIEKQLFETPSYTKEEVAAGWLNYKIKAVLDEMATSRWKKEIEPQIITNPDGSQYAAIYLIRDKIKDRTR